MSNKFNKPTLSHSDKEKKAEEFIDFENVSIKMEKKVPERILKKEQTKMFLMRLPESLFHDIKEIVAITGISMNAICLESLRPEVKKKLKELKDIL